MSAATDCAAAGCRYCAADLAGVPRPYPYPLTSAQRDENRLTGEDRETIAAAMRPAARAIAARAGELERFARYDAVHELAVIGYRSIGCDARDLRGSELTEFDRVADRILWAAEARSDCPRCKGDGFYCARCVAGVELDPLPAPELTDWPAECVAKVMRPNR